ncbi:MAG: FkbM family methyltransferase [Pyrinomonadaceae bacterium]|nr:FkbM family methyltransferase [Pyrinomonadaceae bacterium]
MTDKPAALKSAKVVARQYYGQLYWAMKPHAPLPYRFPLGGTLLLEPRHAFTGVFWPDVERYEPDVCKFLQYILKTGATFIDCGANVGFFSIQAGPLVGESGTVISIEANPHTYKLLERNLRANGFGTPVHCALTAEAGEVELFVPGSWDVYSSLRADGLAEGVADRSFKVKARTLDEVVAELALSRIDLVKIDIEGGELDVLRSAPKVLSAFRPFIIMEYGLNTWPAFDVTGDDLKRLAREFGYTINLFSVQEQRLIPVTDEVWESGYVNLILSPIEARN